MNKAYFKEYYDLERNHWWFRVRENIIRDQLTRGLPAARSLKILNVGAATGRSSEMLAEFGQVCSIEYDQECFEFTRDNVPIQIIQGTILDLPFPPETFDLVCAFDVIEHVEDDEKAVSEMKRVCKTNGLVCITVPALPELWSHHDTVNHHFRRYRLRQIRNLFEKTPGKVLFESYFNFLLLPPVFIYRKLHNWLPKWFTKSGSGSDFSAVGNKFTNRLLFSLFSLEKKLLHYVSFPSGVSILYLWKK